MVAIYSKEGCGKCEAAKKNMERMNIEYETRDVFKYTNPHEGWRIDGSIKLLAAYHGGGLTLPIIQVDDDYLDYPTAMKRFKAARKAAK